jgi:hypothetical protein
MKSFYETVRSLESSIACGRNSPQRLFSVQKGAQRRQNIATLKKVIGLLSGGENREILGELHSSHFGRLYFPEVDTRHSKCLEKIRDEFHSAKGKERRTILSLVADSHSRQFLENIGFKISGGAYASAREYSRSFFFYSHLSHL